MEIISGLKKAKKAHYGKKGIYQGFLFNLSKPSSNGMNLYWNCHGQKKADYGYCTARVTTDLHGGIVSAINNVHHHLPSAGDVEAVKTLLGMKQRALATQEATADVVAFARGGVTLGAEGALANKHALSKVQLKNFPYLFVKCFFFLI